jgi:hypothetical protein
MSSSTNLRLPPPGGLGGSPRPEGVTGYCELGELSIQPALEVLTGGASIQRIAFWMPLVDPGEQLENAGEQRRDTVGVRRLLLTQLDNPPR